MRGQRVRRQRFGRRVVALAGAATLLGTASVALASSTPRVQPVVLPRDQGAHPAFNIEWWYTAGTLRGSDHHDFFWFATIWSGGGGEVAKVNVVDLRTDQIVLSHEYASSGSYTAGLTHLTVGAYSLRYQARSRWGRWSLGAPVDAKDGLTLRLTPSQPYVLNGRHGIIRQGSGGPSAYYSNPRLTATGALQVAGQTIDVKGQGWFDHQWGNFGSSTGALRWNWFACQFDNGSDMMLYQFLNAKDRPSGITAATLVGRNGTVTHPSHFTVTPLRPSIRPAGAHESYPLRWRLEVPADGMTLTLKARARNQFIENELVPSFWEGTSAITRGRPGSCIVESSREAS